VTSCFLRILTRHGTIVLALGLLSGIVFPAVATFLRPSLPVAVAVILTLAMLRVDWQRMLDYGRRPVLMSSALAWYLIGAPVVVWWIVTILDVPAGLAGGLIMMAAAPPLMGTPAVALLIGLDVDMSMIHVTVAHLLVFFTAPFVALELLGLELAIDSWALAGRLGLIIGLSLVAGLVGRRLMGSERLERWKGEIDGLAVIVLVVFGIAIMDGVTALLLSDPEWIAIMTVVAFVANLALQGAGALMFGGLGMQAALTAGFMTGNRNMALFLAALPATTHPDILLYFAIGQLPMYCLPALLKPVYSRLLPERA